MGGWLLAVVMLAGCGEPDCPEGTEYDGVRCVGLDAGAGDAGPTDDAATPPDASDGGCACDPRAHATSTCEGAECTYECDPGWDDCDADPTNGCELDVRNDIDNCGACGTPCAWECVEGACDDPVELTAGDGHACARRSSGRVACWGSNGAGQLGDGTTIDALTPVEVVGLHDAIAIATGSGHTCAVRATGEVSCWGNHAATGFGEDTSRPRPMPEITEAAQVAAGANFTCARRDNGDVACWGTGNQGQLGDGTTESSDTPRTVLNITGVTTVAAGYYHACAIDDATRVWCWGYNENGMAGDEGPLRHPEPIEVSGIFGASLVRLGALHSCGLRGGIAYCWGLNGYGALGDDSMSHAIPEPVAGFTDAVFMDAGVFSTCAVRESGAVLCWGRGPLGDGTVDDSSSPVRVSGLMDAQSVAVGQRYACAHRSDATIWCWGTNSDGRLGDGTTSDRLMPVQVVPPG